MDPQEYVSALKKVNECGKNASEKEINIFFLNLKIDFIDCDAKIKSKEDKTPIGEIDGIFRYGDRFLFLIETDESSKVDTKKQDSFFSKWSDKTNQEIIMNRYNLPKNLQPIKIFVCYGESRKSRKDKPSIRHEMKDSTNAILFKEDVEYFLKTCELPPD